MTDKCTLCLSSEKDEVMYGEFATRSKMSAHYFCVLLATDLPQRGSDKCGFYGFLLRDVKELASKLRGNVCYYCNKKSASIKCKEPTCERMFHMICGLKGKCNFEFVGNFESSCHEHNTYNIPLHIDSLPPCAVCCEAIADTYPLDACDILIPPCCSNCTLHKVCAAKYCLVAGYLTKCPSCCSVDFVEFARARGVFVPTRPALWEPKKHCDDELLSRHFVKCIADSCMHKKRRPEIFCQGCGSFPYHIVCLAPNVQPDTYNCAECAVFAERIKTRETNEIYDNPTFVEPNVVDLTIDYGTLSMHQLFDRMNEAVIEMPKPLSDGQQGTDPQHNWRTSFWQYR